MVPGIRIIRRVLRRHVTDAERVEGRQRGGSRPGRRRRRRYLHVRQPRKRHSLPQLQAAPPAVRNADRLLFGGFEGSRSWLLSSRKLK
jgi:hypothetical protein